MHTPCNQTLTSKWARLWSGSPHDLDAAAAANVTHSVTPARSGCRAHLAELYLYTHPKAPMLPICTCRSMGQAPAAMRSRCPKIAVRSLARTQTQSCEQRCFVRSHGSELTGNRALSRHPSVQHASGMMTHTPEPCKGAIYLPLTPHGALWYKKKKKKVHSTPAGWIVD